MFPHQLVAQFVVAHSSESDVGIPGKPKYCFQHFVETELPHKKCTASRDLLEYQASSLAMTLHLTTGLFAAGLSQYFL
jgi:hypothetical protein